MLHKLRCLKACYFDEKMEMSLDIVRGVKLHWSIGCLKALTQLQFVDANYGGVKLIEELGRLSQLEYLSLVNLTRETGRALCVSIENMNCLKDLFVSSINEDEVIDLQPISSPPKCLQFLRIEGCLAKLPDWISELQHLVSLQIYWTRLSDDPLKAFQNLPNLAELILEIKAYNGKQLHIGKGGFPKLKELRLIDLSELNSVNIEKDAFPLLEKLNFGGCPQLKEVPSGFQHLRNLKELNIGDMPTEFEKSLDPEQGSHYWIIQHVPFILLHHKVREGIYGYESRNLRSKDLERSRGQTINQDDDNKNNISGDDIRVSVEKGSQSLKNIEFNVYFGGPLDNPGGIDGFPFRGEGIECYYMMIRRKLKTLNDLKRKIMEELNLNRAWYDIKITYRYPQEILHERINYGYMAIKEDKHVKMIFNRIQKMPQVNAAELYVSLEALAKVYTETVQQTTTFLQFTALDDRCTTMGEHIMGEYTMGDYTLPTQDHVANTGETLHPQETHLEEEDEEEDHAMNDGENVDDVDEYEERIDQGDFEYDVDDHEVVPIFEEENMENHDEGDADDDIGVQHDTNMTTAYAPPSESFYANTWENMVDPSALQIPFVSTWEDGMHFSKGLTFANKEAVKRALIIYAARDNRNFIIRRSTTTKLCAACIDTNCKWYVGAFKKDKLNGLWMITSYVGPHICIPFGRRRDGKMMDSNFVASEIVGKLRQKHTAPIDELWEIIHTKYKHELSYYKVWDAKQKAIAKIYGDWEESYQRLRKLLLAYLDQDSGTRYSYYTIPRGIDDTTLLRYVFWAFAPCIAAFRYCRPVISIDGTHLYGKYRGMLMIAMAIDANQKVLPLAFAVVDKESRASWRWFLECFRTSIEHVIPAEGICIISDRHKGIKCAI
nr:uncharacterized protein LOC111984617 [Quercus suber]